ncbi:MAG: element excision factor XisH family protein [Chitinophagaceae bacterium]
MGRKRGYIDLAAEKIIAAQKGEQKIAVEIKSFIGVSDLDEFEDALGQFLIYKVALEKEDINRVLFLAVPKDFYGDFFDDSFFVEILKRFEMKLIVFDEQLENIVQWII